MFMRFFSLVRFFLTIVYDTSLLHLESVFSGFLRDDVQIIIADFVRQEKGSLLEYVVDPRIRRRRLTDKEYS